MSGIRSTLPAAYSLISPDVAIELLRGRIAYHGSARAYAAHLNVSEAFISPMLSGKRRITGIVAKDLNLESINAYRFNVNNVGTLQGDYQRSREAHRNANPVVGKAQPGQRFPDRAEGTVDVTEEYRLKAAVEAEQLRQQRELQEKLWEDKA